MIYFSIAYCMKMLNRPKNNPRFQIVPFFSNVWKRACLICMFFFCFVMCIFYLSITIFFNSDEIETKTRLIFHCSTIHLSSCERHISEFLRFHETFDSAWQVWLPDFRFRQNLASNFGKHLEFWWPAFDHRRLSACFQRGHAKLSCIQIPLEICIAWRE